MEEKQKDRETAERQKDREAEMERMKLEAERLRVDAEESTKQREFELKMRELKASVNAQREQINTENGSGDGAWPQMASMKALKLPPYNHHSLLRQKGSTKSKKNTKYKYTIRTHKKH